MPTSAEQEVSQCTDQKHELLFFRGSHVRPVRCRQWDELRMPALRDVTRHFTHHQTACHAAPQMGDAEHKLLGAIEAAVQSKRRGTEENQHRRCWLAFVGRIPAHKIPCCVHGKIPIDRAHNCNVTRDLGDQTEGVLSICRGQQYEAGHEQQT